MAGYVKRIALIKTVGKGFSSDGGPLGGLVKCEAYAGFLKAELSLINFAPLTEGRYRFGLTDGKSIVIFDDTVFESEVEFDLTRGFAALVCFCNGGTVKSVASAVCGDNFAWLTGIEREIGGQEQAALSPEPAAYEDEAIAEVNYYELEVGSGGRSVREDKEEKEDGSAGGKDEEVACPVEKAQADRAQYGVNGDTDGEKRESSGDRCEGSEKDKDNKSYKLEGLDGGDDCDGGFFGRMEGDVKKIFADYPREERLERAIEGSRWAKIGYGGGRHYAFGVIYAEGNAKYLCYGVPSDDGANCPASLKGRATYMPVEGGGYWIMYQDARTGVSIVIDVS
ncbi:MAG: hypothetical protein ACI4L9_01230 [Candidatus Coproplasma sp.]